MADLLVIPDSVNTKRLVLRAPHEGDAPFVYEAIVESLPELREWLPWALKEPSLSESCANAKKARDAFFARQDLRYYMFAQETGRFVGSTGLHRIDWQIPKFEIGFWVRSSCQGKGLVTEAVERMIEVAFHDLAAKRVEIRCDERHVKSRAIAEKTGFVLEGVLRNDSLTPDGRLRNTAVYSRVEKRSSK